MRTQQAVVVSLFLVGTCAWASCALDEAPATSSPVVDGVQLPRPILGPEPMHLRRLGETCIDRDGDGHGLFCTAGPDCDDHDPSVQVGCDRCADPAAGCPCAAGAPDVPCGTRLGGDCMRGSLRCVDGRYSECSDLSLAGPAPVEPGTDVPAGFRRFAFTGDPCDACDLTCRNDPRIPGCVGVVPADACATDADCPGGRTCGRGYCLCATDANCAAGQFCQGLEVDPAAPMAAPLGYCVDTSLCSGTAGPDEIYDRAEWNPMPEGGARPGVTIGEGQTIFSRYAWVANNGQTTVSKVCLEDCPDAWDQDLMHPVGSEVGRYLVGSGPSRTAIDGVGDSYVGNRWDGYLTSFAGDWSHCDPDRNGDVAPCAGTLPARPAGWPPAGPANDAYCFLQTSTGGLTGAANWLSPRDNPLTGGLPRDECMRWHIPVAGGNIARSVAVGPGRPGEGAPGGWIYVGSWNNPRAYKVHPAGCIVNSAGCQTDAAWPAAGWLPIGLSSYGAVGFEQGDIWFQQLQQTAWSGLDGDTGAGSGSFFSPPSGHYIRNQGWMSAGYGISQDQHHRLWQAGWAEAGPVIYDPGIESAPAGGYMTALTSSADDSWCHIDVSAIGTATLNASGAQLANTRGISGDNVNDFEIFDGAGNVLNTVSNGSQWMSFWYGGATIMVQMRTPDPLEGCPYCNTWREYTIVWLRTPSGTCSSAGNVWVPGCYGPGWIERTGTTGTVSRVCLDPACATVIPSSYRLINNSIASFCTAYTASSGGGPRGYRDWRVWGHGVTPTSPLNAGVGGWPLGVGLDPAGRPITINNRSGNNADASLVDPSASTWPLAQAWTTYPTTVPRFNNIYTYSDFTGSLRDMFSDPMGRYTKRYECNAMEVGVWGDLRWDTTVFVDQEIVISARVGSTIPELEAATLVEIARIPPSPLASIANIAAAIDGRFGPMTSRRRYLEVQFSLVRSAGDTTSPVLHDFNLDWHCVPVL